MKNNKGFSLVELIVVIAIMAILAAVAVIGVSVYIPKAQQANDEQMISDLEYILITAGYAGDFTEGEGGYIVLSTEGIVNRDDIVDGSALDVTLKNAYGEDYKNTLKLSYDEWGGTVATFNDSSYAGKTDQLLGTVTNLTGALGGLLEDGSITPDVFGENFNGYLGGLGIDPTKDPTATGNAAVLYVAQNTAGKADATKDAVANAIASVNGQGLTTGSEEWADAVVQAMSGELTGELGTAGGMAAMYAYAEAFGQYHGDTTALNNFHESTKFENVANAGQAMDEIEGAFKDLLLAGSSSVGNYLTVGEDGKSQSDKDLEGYVSALGMVNQSSSSLEGSLSNKDAFTNAANELLTQYLDVEEGQIGILFRYTKGMMTVSNTLPENAD